jgi:nicotinamide riboside transporter PnuC
MDESVRERVTKDGQTINDVLDEDEQQKVIDVLEMDYRRLVRTEKLIGSGIAVIAMGLCIFLGFITGGYNPFLSSATAFFTVFVWLVLRRRIIWLVSIAVELLSIYAWYHDRQYFDAIVPILVHTVYAIHVFFALSSYWFVGHIPERIKHLEGLKYGVKLA